MTIREVIQIYLRRIIDIRLHRIMNSFLSSHWNFESMHKDCYVKSRPSFKKIRLLRFLHARCRGWSPTKAFDRVGGPDIAAGRLLQSGGRDRL